MAEQVRKPIPKKSKTGKGYEILVYLILVLAVYAVLSLFVYALVMYSFNTSPDAPDDYGVHIIYGKETLHKLKESQANNEYGLYVPFSYLSEISSFGLAGDGDNISLFVIGTDNRIECTVNSSLVVINDNPVRIASPILFDDESGEYLIPVSLVSNYITGIDVNFDDEKMICKISSSGSKANVSIKILLPEPMKGAYFPDSYKYYTQEEASKTE